MKLKNKRAIVTGGSRGIGKAIVFNFAVHGCKVIFTYQSSEIAAKKLEEEANSIGLQIFGIKADAASFSDAKKTVNFAMEKFSGLDILVNNAGITRDNLIIRMTEEEFDSVILSNLKSVFNYSKLALKQMTQQHYGRIINISSVVGLVGNAGQANYVASKAGIIGFTKSIAKEVASRNITVNAIAPGLIETEMTEKLNEKQLQAILNIGMKRKAAKPNKVADMATFLASDEADFITGQTFIVEAARLKKERKK
jgi:3-oxoacyl-[acyl-carrier protein] reductase